jgi:hypothetical protein
MMLAIHRHLVPMTVTCTVTIPNRGAQLPFFISCSVAGTWTLLNNVFKIN